jgi:hypothetical protein
MELIFSAEVWYWKGPSPFHFVTVPAAGCRDLKAASSVVSYGWGMIPVKARIGSTTWDTSLWPKDGAYIVPLRLSARKAQRIEVGDRIKIQLSVSL